MPRRPDRRWARILVAYLVGAGVLALAGTPVYLLVAAARPHVVRLAAALFVGIVLTHATKALRARLESHGAPLPEDIPPSGPDLAPLLPRELTTLRRDVRASLWSAREFERELWPRLEALAASMGAEPPVKPPRRPLGLGPSLSALRELVAAIERRA